MVSPLLGVSWSSLPSSELALEGRRQGASLLRLTHGWYKASELWVKDTEVHMSHLAPHTLGVPNSGRGLLMGGRARAFPALILP